MNYLQYFKSFSPWTHQANEHHKPTVYILGTDTNTKYDIIEQFARIPLKNNDKLNNKNTLYMNIKPCVKDITDNNVKNSYKIQKKNHITVFNIEDDYLELNIQILPTLSINMYNKTYAEIARTIQNMNKKDIILCMISYTMEYINNNMSISLIKRSHLEKNTFIVFVIPNEITNNQLNNFINDNIKKHLQNFLGYSIIINKPIDNNCLLEHYETHNINDYVNNSDIKQYDVVIGIDNIKKKINEHYETILAKELMPSTKKIIKSNIKKLKNDIDILGVEPTSIDIAKLYYVYQRIVIPIYISTCGQIKLNINYKDSYDFNVYFENVIAFIENIQEIRIDLQDISKLYDLTENETKIWMKYQVWRFSDVNQKISEILLNIFKKKMMEYVKISKPYLLFNLGITDVEMFKIKNIVMTEMLNMDYEQYEYITNIGEGEEIYTKRNTLKKELEHNVNILNDLEDAKMPMLSKIYVLNKNKETYNELYSEHNLNNNDRQHLA